MSKTPKDRHLDVPAEANRDKHVNFVADERSETDPAEDRSVGKLAEDITNNDSEKKKYKRRDPNNER
jgi:hypothetical protein